MERLYFRCRPLDGGAEGGGHLSKADFPSPGNQWGMNFYRQKSGLGDYMQNLTVIFRLVVSGLTGIILVVLGTVNFQFQSPFVPISLWSVL